jgi:hypothetical protein
MLIDISRQEPTIVQLERLLIDVTESRPEISRRSQYQRLAQLLNEDAGEVVITPKGVEKWFDRRSLPGSWMMKIAAMSERNGKPINLSEYA